MKRIFLTFALLSLMVSSYAQSQRYFCEIKGIQKVLSSGLKIVFDFGDNPIYSSWGLNGKQKLVDEKGDEIPFNSMVDAGNYLSGKGWTFQQAYSSVYSDQVIVHWIFYKEAENPEEAVEGIMTKEKFNKQKK